MAYTTPIRSLLETDFKEEPMELSQEAAAVLEQLFRDTEDCFHTALAEIADWAGKYVGAVLRITGLLHGVQHHGFLDFTEVSGQTMEDAVRIGEYFLEHVKAGYEALLNRRKQMESTAITFSGILFQLAELPQIPMEFNESLWYTLVDHVTVYSDERIVFSFTDGTEVVTML